jgi:hypothetical protein
MKGRTENSHENRKDSRNMTKQKISKDNFLMANGLETRHGYQESRVRPWRKYVGMTRSATDAK